MQMTAARYIVMMNMAIIIRDIVPMMTIFLPTYLISATCRAKPTVCVCSRSRCAERSGWLVSARCCAATMQLCFSAMSAWRVGCIA